MVDGWLDNTAKNKTRHLPPKLKYPPRIQQKWKLRVRRVRTSSGGSSRRTKKSGSLLVENKQEVVSVVGRVVPLAGH